MCDLDAFYIYLFEFFLCITKKTPPPAVNRENVAASLGVKDTDASWRSCRHRSSTNTSKGAHRYSHTAAVLIHVWSFRLTHLSLVIKKTSKVSIFFFGKLSFYLCCYLPSSTYVDYKRRKNMYKLRRLIR